MVETQTIIPEQSQLNTRLATETKWSLVEIAKTVTPTEPALRKTATQSSTAISYIDKLKALTYQDYYVLWDSNLSWNGEWFLRKICYILDKDNEISAISVNNPEIIIQYALKPDLMRPTDVTGPPGGIVCQDSWSPDSTAFIVWGSYGPKRIDFLTILDINKPESLEEALSRWKGICCAYDKYWSPDSSRIALDHGKEGIWIIDKLGNVKRKVPIPDTLFIYKWIEEGILTIDNNPGNGNELSLINPDTGIINKLFSYEKAFQIIGYSNKYHRLLLLEKTSSTFLIFDFKTQQIVYRISIHFTDDDPNVISIPSTQYIGLNIHESGSDYGIWIFDWNTQNLTYNGEKSYILIWSPILEGFLYIRDDKYLDVLKP